MKYLATLFFTFFLAQSLCAGPIEYIGCKDPKRDYYDGVYIFQDKKLSEFGYLYLSHLPKISYSTNIDYYLAGQSELGNHYFFISDVTIDEYFYHEVIVGNSGLVAINLWQGPRDSSNPHPSSEKIECFILKSKPELMYFDQNNIENQMN